MSRHWTAPTVVVGAIAIAVLAGIATAQVPCACEGRCQYGVEGTCIPRRATYGYYQSQWRRWPLEPPRVSIPAELPGPPADSRFPVQELPEPRDEADVTPEFPHLRKRPTASGAGGNAPSETDPTKDPFQDDPVPSFELPSDDASSKAPALKRLIATKPAGYRSLSAPSARPEGQLRTVSASAQIASGNPLRTRKAAPVPPRPLPGAHRASHRRQADAGPSLSASPPSQSRATRNPLRGN